VRREVTVRIVVAGAPLVVVVSTTFAFLLMAIAQLRGYVITGEERFLEPWNAARAVFPAQARTLERLAGDDLDDLRRVRTIVQGVASHIQEYATPLLEAVRRNDVSPHSIATTDEGKQRVDALRAEVNSLRTVEHARVSTRQGRADAAAGRAVVGVAGSLLLVLVFTGYLTRVIVLPVRRAAGMAGRLAGGDLGAGLPETGAGKIGGLERAFNTMGGSIGDEP
jgi:CHASE3 domain sensor protein